MSVFWAAVKPTRGASPKKRKATSKVATRYRVPWKSIGMSLVLVSLLGFMGWSLYKIEPLKIIQEYTNRPIANVSIQGEFKYASQAHIEALVAEKLSNTFLELDIMALKSHLEKHPWIDRAVVARQWPDTLLIKIIEQQPIARWNNQGFLNLRGEIVNLSNKTELNHLPLLRADDRYTERVMQQYVLMAKLLSEYQFAPLVLELDNTLAWSLTIAPAVTIKLGRDDSIEKLQRLMRVLQHDLNHHAAYIETVDMRYKQGFAISWKQDTAVAIDGQ
ncbi:cell division protein FtsQ/DivIB [Marinagarivorans algicola]|uniref:cell division protein FtsQ/DivIB n=1 Tax=Marinagarivorans algicola TaxID=1513270 RepID=UPI0006B6894E|nr:FtsQ-type POTRA domain-containing protein [Marinagarivorans algicola]